MLAILAHPALGTSRTFRNVLFRRRPLRGLEKMPTQRLNKRKSIRENGCFFFCLSGRSQAARKLPAKYFQPLKIEAACDGA